MSRDHTKLRVFAMADALVLDVYRMTKTFPVEERFGLQSQTRRASVSAATNIVEGCARRTTRDYVHFLTVALSSATETRYLLTLASRLGMLDQHHAAELDGKYDELSRALEALTRSLAAADGSTPRRVR